MINAMILNKKPGPDWNSDGKYYFPPEMQVGYVDTIWKFRFKQSSFDQFIL